MLDTVLNALVFLQHVFLQHVPILFYSDNEITIYSYYAHRGKCDVWKHEPVNK